MHEKARESLNRLIRMFEGSGEELPTAVANSFIKRQHSDAPIARWSLLNRLIVITHDTSDASTSKIGVITLIYFSFHTWVPMTLP
jgi:hypothetical protein